MNRRLALDEIHIKTLSDPNDSIRIKKPLTNVSVSTYGFGADNHLKAFIEHTVEKSTTVLVNDQEDISVYLSIDHSANLVSAVIDHHPSEGIVSKSEQFEIPLDQVINFITTKGTKSNHNRWFE